MRTLTLLLSTFICSGAIANVTPISCWQEEDSADAPNHRYIFSELGLSLTAEGPGLDVSSHSVGKGDTSPNSDGTISESLYIGPQVTLFHSDAYAARSAEWRESVAFVLPILPSGSYVFYIKQADFDAALNEGSEFVGRLKVEISGTKRNYKMRCVQS